MSKNPATETHPTNKVGFACFDCHNPAKATLASTPAGVLINSFLFGSGGRGRRQGAFVPPGLVSAPKESHRDTAYFQGVDSWLGGVKDVTVHH